MCDCEQSAPLRGSKLRLGLVEKQSQILATATLREGFSTRRYANTYVLLRSTRSDRIIFYCVHLLIPVDRPLEGKVVIIIGAGLLAKTLVSQKQHLGYALHPKANYASVTYGKN
ncbi:hypothetical protein WKK05_17540 [Nostoc sp. UHCC 0302]|uniref:hypothetical protein n=1 Tax=Nostoc sp. UHCC 0302 TaxID=3134896 RepID=UPI00311CBF63